MKALKIAGIVSMCEVKNSTRAFRGALLGGDVSTIGQNLGILLSFYDLRQQYDYAKAALATATEHNLDTLRTVRAIEDAYTAWCSDDCRLYSDSYYKLDRAADDLPDEFWIA